MIVFDCFSQSDVVANIPPVSRMLVVAFGGGSGGSSTGDGWSGGVAASHYTKKAIVSDTVFVGAGTSSNESAKAGSSKLLNTVATGGGTQQHGLTYETSSGTQQVYDNGVGAMGHWLSSKEHDRSNLMIELSNYVSVAWPELIDDASWKHFVSKLSVQTVQQTMSSDYVEYDIDGICQPGAYGVGPDKGGVSGAVFVFREEE